MLFHPSANKISSYAEHHNLKKLLPLVADKDASVRAEVAAALGTFQEDDAYNQLIGLLRDPEPQVQIAAVKALQNQCYATAADHVKHLMNTTDNEELKKACAQAHAAIVEKHGHSL